MPKHTIEAEIASLRTGPGEIRALIAAIPAALLDWKPADESHWSPRQVVSHLLDAEIAFGARIRHILTEERPEYPPFDEEAWVQRKGPAEADLDIAWPAWLALRDVHIALFRELDEGALNRVGIHMASGEQSVRDIAAGMARHDQYHLVRLRQWSRLVSRRDQTPEPAE